MRMVSGGVFEKLLEAQEAASVSERCAGREMSYLVE